MTDEVLENYIRQYIEAQQIPEVTISWQGGEPTLMGLEFFQKSVELVEKYKKPGMQISYSMQTNGTKLDDAWAEFFKENNFNSHKCILACYLFCFQTIKKGDYASPFLQ